MPSAPAVVVKVSPSDSGTRSTGVLCTLLLIFLYNPFSAGAQYVLKKRADIALGSVSTSLFATSLILQHRVTPLSVSDLAAYKPGNINRFDRSACYNWNPDLARASDVLGVAAGLAFLYFPINKSSRKDVPEIANVAFQSLMISQSLSNVFKLSKRTRPYVYGDKAPLEDKLSRGARFSFFSAHTASVSSLCYSFAFAHKTYVTGGKYNAAVWAGTALIPAVQGYLRVKSGKHFPSDVVVGYLTGFAGAYLMHLMHSKP